MNKGFFRVASAIPAVKVADVEYNVAQTLALVEQAAAQGARVVVFPELNITGYTCQDLFAQSLLLEAAEEGVRRILRHTAMLDIITVVGVPVVFNNLLLNCAALVCHGQLYLIPKTYLPNYGEFYEKRWFASSANLNDGMLVYAGQQVELVRGSQLFQTTDGVCLGVEICEDVWAPEPVSTRLALSGADIIVNLSASDELIGKHDYLIGLLHQQSARLICGYVYTSCGFGESTQDVVYGGNALIFDNGQLLAQGERFMLEPQLVLSEIDVERLRAERRRNTTYLNAQVDYTAPVRLLQSTPPDDDDEPLRFRTVEPHPFIPTTDNMSRSCQEIFNIQVGGLAQRLHHIQASTVVVGISGGLDSTLALLVCVKTFDKLQFDRKGIVGVTMPGFGTTDRTHHNAVKLMQSLGITIREIPIRKAVLQHFVDIGHDAGVHDVTYENSQARERTQILMDLSNQLGGIVVGTGDLSELALGWATYNGDHMSMYGVNAGVPKTLIQYLVRYVASNEVPQATADILLDIVDTPISPELTPADTDGNIQQKTEDLVGPYELHDFFLYYFLRYGFSPAKIFMLARKAFGERYDDAAIKHWLTTFARRFFNQQFKRSCLPDGPKVGSVSLSPRGDWRMPSDATSALWLKQCNEL